MESIEVVVVQSIYILIVYKLVGQNRYYIRYAHN